MPKVLYEKRDRVAYVTINRPEAKNAIDPETHQLLWQTWEDFRDDDALDVAILTGAGDAFCGCFAASLAERRTISHQFYQARKDVDEWMRLAASVLAQHGHGASLVTPGPTSSTTPAPSWPPTIG